MEETTVTQTPTSPSNNKPHPGNIRSNTEPTPTVLFHGHFNDKDLLEASNRPRMSKSPYLRSHYRSRSTGATPPMARSHSSPTPLSPSSRLADRTGPPSPTPMRSSPKRTSSPLKQDIPTRSAGWHDSDAPDRPGGIEAIQEDSELDLTPRAIHLRTPSPLPSSFSRSNSLRNMRRPASPLPNTSTTSTSNSPSVGPQRYNEPHPFLHSYSSTSSFSSHPSTSSFSSHSSTPTSLRSRSRSPSISSLDTIEDAPEQEQRSEAEQMEQLKLAAEAGESSDGESEGPRRRSLDAPRGFGFARGRREERKRWSICGGERRADLDLETIWED